MSDVVPRILIFVAATVALAAVSRASLRRPRSHGFYRFFAWECIVALVLLDFVSLREWFADPFSIRQVASWLLLLASIAVGLAGIRELSLRGGADAAREHAGATLDFEKTTHLVTSGVFRYVRHPLYASLLLLAWGVFLKRPSGAGAALAAAATALLAATAQTEEGENVRYFGRAYADYARRSRRFIPFVF